VHMTEVHIRPGMEGMHCGNGTAFGEAHSPFAGLAGAVCVQLLDEPRRSFLSCLDEVLPQVFGAIERRGLRICSLGFNNGSLRGT